ncbi:protein FREE1-like [Diospyros lotus]|uniref:protein FREE1-like n=1 Tax=Diospyros lotus TaxID=55363 RepID=UPI002252A53F|nr:protein FREE1-like [Diospyros lotus]
MQQSDTSSYHPYYQPHLQNPNPSFAPPNDPSNPNPNPFPATHASAPPVVSNYPSSDYSTYSSYPQYADHTPNPSPLTHPANPGSQSYSNPSPQPYAFPHLNPQPTPYYPYDHNQAALNYDHGNPGPDSNPNSSFPANSYSPVANYESLYESGTNYGSYGEQGLFGGAGKQRPDVAMGYGGFSDGVGGDGVYAYNGGNKEPYGARGSGSEASSRVIFDDYGRPLGFSDGKEQNGSGRVGKVVKAIPKTEPTQDMGSGVQKFRVKLLCEGAGQSDMDVLCQVGLDGIRILDPATSRTLRIYTLETVTRWEILDSYIFAFWSQSSVDIEPKRIRLKSNSYTSNNILDTVTAATFQFKEIGGSNKPSDILNAYEQQPSERKKGLADWMNIMKPQNEEKDHWVPDEAVVKCSSCGTQFNAFIRRHHCRNCGDIFCDKCTQGRIALTADQYAVPVRVCDRCMAEVSQRLANPNRKVTPPQSHEDLAKKLKEEMEKNRKASSGLTSDASGTRMKEVACPTCTVHLQVQVPVSGSETIECSVCQHPFLVSAH